MLTTTNSNAAAAAESFDPTAWIALALSILGLLVTLILRYLDGPRVRVRLRTLLLDIALGASITYNKGAWPIPEKDGQRYRRLPDPGNVVELAEIVIENTGRHPLTVYDIGLSWRGRRKAWWKRRVHHSVVPNPLRPQQDEDTKYASGDRFRVEPSDIVVLLIDYWGTVRQNRPGHRDKLKLRAVVSVAGRHRLKRSSLRLRWVIPDSANSVIGGKSLIPLRALVARTAALIILGASKDHLYNLAYMARSLEEHIGGAWPSEWDEQYDLVKAFFESPDNEHHLAIYTEKESLKRTLPFSLVRVIDEQQDIVDWTDIERVRRSRNNAVPSETLTPPDVESAPAKPVNILTTRRVNRPVGPPEGEAAGQG